jgi:hypothetical protein
MQYWVMISGRCHFKFFGIGYNLEFWRGKEDYFNFIDKGPQICYYPTVTSYNFLIKLRIIREIYVLWLL